MSKALLFCVIFLRILFACQASQRCDFSECNYEGECYEDNNIKSCTCFGSKYFMGPKCFEVVNNCQNENPCQNGGNCKNIVGQFICENCDAGFGGLWCDLEISNIFQKLILYFNHYAFYGETHKFIIMMETLGTTSFSLEFVSDNYAIDSFETIPTENNKWTYSQDLTNEIKNLGIRYYRDLPYLKGYYYIASSIFWNVGSLDLFLRSYDSATAIKLLYQNQFKLFLLTRNEKECVPNLSFIYGRNPLDPLKLDIARYNNFEIVLNKRCSKNSQIVYYWSVYSIIGDQNLCDFGTTDKLILKIPPFQLGFSYQGEVMSTYRIVVKMVEKYDDKQVETQARCFIFLLPKPVFANIRGGDYREISYQQTLILDASGSRDFALAPNAFQDMLFTWNCRMSDNDVNQMYSTLEHKIASSSSVKLELKKSFVNKTFNFALTVRSKINKFISDETYQIVKIVTKVKLDVDIKCLRNCIRNEFVQNDLMHLKVEPLVGEFSNGAIFKWYLENESKAEMDNFIYLTLETDEILNIKVSVQDGTLSGKASKTFKVNLRPAGGSCSIKPQSGDAVHTTFYVKCENYVDKDEPLNYEYLTATGFPLQRTNEAAIFTKLPPCNSLLINICDQFQACTKNILNVMVNPLNEINDVKSFLNESGVGLKILLKTGDIFPAMIALKSLAPFIKTADAAAILINEMMEFDLQTLLQAEEFLEISRDLVHHNIPLTAKKAEIFNQYFLKLQQGFMALLKDDEISAFKRVSYEKCCKEILQTMQLFSQTWEIIDAVHIAVKPSILSSNPLIEIKTELPDFDIKIALRLESWLEISKTIQHCLALINMGSTHLYKPWEDNIFVNENNINLRMYSVDNEKPQDIQLNEIKIVIDQACIRDLHKTLGNQNILIQAIALNSNPFWWYPNEIPLNSEVFLLSTFGDNDRKNVKYLEQPFQFQVKLEANKSSDNVIIGLIKNNLHKPVYTINLPANAVLIVTFLNAERSLKFLVEINKIPTSYEVSKSGYMVQHINEHQTFAFANHFNRDSKGFMAILLDAHYENVSFSFSVEIRECLYWDYSLKPPQWSSSGCKPKLEIPQNNSLTCYCCHFSTFGARSYAAPIQEDLKEHWLLTQLAINWYLVGFYSSLITIFAFILLLNHNRYKNHIKYLPTHSSSRNDNDIEVCIFTGSQLNATCTANITLRLISQKGPFSLTINQDPDNPFLKRNSICRLLISSQQVNIPLKLTLSNDMSGRYPSWYCHKIIVKNLKNLQQKIFLINQWICEKPLEIFEPVEKQLQFKERFRENLNKIYINWYQYQSLCGCWLYKDSNCLKRCCIEISFLMVCICFIAIYFGPTTMQTYEAERILYNLLEFDIPKLFLLSIACYVFYFVIKLIFSLMLHS